jgi:antitoxin YefM
MSSIPLADAKNRLSEIVQSALDTHERTTITRHGRPAVVLMAVEDLEALEETIAWLSDPSTKQDIEEAATGDTLSVEQARAELAARRR